MLETTFSNREIASAIWLAAAFVFVLFKSDIRKSMGSVVIAFLQPKILLSVICMMLYTGVFIGVLSAFHLWDVTLLKDTLLWFCLTGVVSAFRFITAQSARSIIAKIATDSLRIMVVIEFLVNTYTFSLLGELILVPLITFLAMLNVVAKMNAQYSSVAKLTSGLLTVIGITVLAFAVTGAVADYRNLLTLHTVETVLLPPLLSVLLSPLIYAMMLYANYEILFIRLRMGPKKDRVLMRYAKRRLFAYCRLSVAKVRDCLHTDARELMRLQCATDVDELFCRKRLSNKRIRRMGNES